LQTLSSINHELGKLDEAVEDLKFSFEVSPGHDNYPSESEPDEEDGADGMDVDAHAPPAAADSDGGD
jgi:hypothetical protein